MSKKRISICTLNGYFNYGNRLQLFALSKILKGSGYYVTVFWPKSLKQKIKEFVRYSTPLRLRYPKEVKLRRFTKLYVPKIAGSLEKVCVYGSDQVWNPKYLRTRPYLLGDDRCVNISYAASLGTSKLTREQTNAFFGALKRFSAISVREQSAKELLRPLTRKNIATVLDPTLLLDEEQYDILEKFPKDLKDDEKYVLCYILGNRDYEETIRAFSKKNNYRVIIFSDKAGSKYGIEEFLYLIHHAELICTDSFHACVFSFIFERPFIAFRRTGKENYMYTRLKNLIDTFKLQNREFNGKDITKENLEIDYTEAKKILKKEQKKSLDFLKKALDIKE